ncbi:MAG: hypothetical protein ACYS0G_12860 [Planctomycetota bacterium]
MTEVYEHNPEDHDDPVATPTWLVGLFGAVALVVIILGLTALYYNAKAEAFREQVLSRDRLDVLELRRQQEALLGGPPRWVERDEQGETVEALVIPIERAMALVVEEANPGAAAAPAGGGVQ